VIALFESGNSRLHFSWWDNDAVNNAVSIPYPESIESLTNIITDLLGGEHPEKIAACSVSSQWREPLFKALNKYAPGRLFIARTAFDIPFEVKYDKPETIGVDRILAGYAAYRFFGDSCVVVDSGTAVTVDAIAENGTFAGGYIFPGLNMLAGALYSQTALPNVAVKVISDGIGNSTEMCISYGAGIGFSGAVSNLIRHAAAITESTDRIVVTGGNAVELLSSLPFECIHRPHLVLEGLGYSIDTLSPYS